VGTEVEDQVDPVFQLVPLRKRKKKDMYWCLMMTKEGRIR
jgi:hypothetical protein